MKSLAESRIIWVPRPMNHEQPTVSVCRVFQTALADKNWERFVRGFETSAITVASQFGGQIPGISEDSEACALSVGGIPGPTFKT